MNAFNPIRPLAGLAALLMAALPVSAQDKTVELRLSHWLPPSHLLHKSFQDWGNSIEKESNGTIKFKIFPAQQLGKAFDHYDIARDGIADFAFVVPGYQPGRFPIFDAVDLPFVLSNAKAGSVAVDEWYRKYAAREMKDVKFCFALVHDPGSFHSTKRKIVVPADIKGLKIRPGQATIARFVTLLGASNVNSSAPEARDLLEKGVVDAVTLPWGAAGLFGVDKATKYHMEVPLYAAGFVWIMNPGKYRAMSASQKKVIDNHCNSDWALRFATPWADFEHSGIAKMKADPSREVYGISSEQLAQWRHAAEPLLTAWRASVKKARGDDDAIWKDLQVTLQKHNSAY